jgi:hypothetical protein
LAIEPADQRCQQLVEAGTGFFVAGREQLDDPDEDLALRVDFAGEGGEAGLDVAQPCKDFVRLGCVSIIWSFTPLLLSDQDRGGRTEWIRGTAPVRAPGTAGAMV